jgi:hypothetical protein
MDRLSEFGTARGFAQQDVERAKRELARAEAEFAARDLAYQRCRAEVKAESDAATGGLHPSYVCGLDCSGCCDDWEWK